MRNARYLAATLAAVALLAVLGCSASNHSADDEAEVYFTADITLGPADVNVGSLADVNIPQMTIYSRAKSPNVTPSNQQDAVFTEWVVTATRTDGGTVASPQWRNFYNVYVPGGGSASLGNYRIFPNEYLRQNPLDQLFPANGGIDRETGKTNIRQRLQIDMYGKTIAGKRVVCSFDVNLQFYYQ